MKHLIILGDGMADWPVESLGNKTLLQYANTPYMDMLAKNGRTGMLKTVQDGFHPGSEVANSSILGYDQNEVYEGRGPLEAASIGVELAPDDMAIRCNIICIEGDHIKNHSCGHLETAEGDILIKYLQEHLANDTEVVEKYGHIVHFYTGVQYRHLLVVNGGSKHLKCTPPHDVPLKPWKPLLVQPDLEAEAASDIKSKLSATETAELINLLIIKSQKLLSAHPFNTQRIAEGKDPANSIWPWAGGYRPHMVPVTTIFPQIKRGSVITAVDLIRGIGALAGLRVIDVKGATGLADTNYEGKAAAAVDALKTDDFVYLHIEASDEAGHDGNLELKLSTIDYLDRRAIGPIYEAVKDWGKPGTPTADLEPVAIAVLPDHPTPVAHRTHTNEPIPFLIYAPGIQPDSVETFDELSCKNGYYGLLEKDEFIRAFMNVD
ncbi:MAG: cofactor-independent phosphoglycerate mutase [Prevotellaceae bacterium]|nr:cofactor-independent phosphoglycerate mutase [Candidatus Minthosoma caballi]